MNKEKQASFICESCEARLNVDVSQDIAVCDYCGSRVLVSELIKESDEVKIHKIKVQAYKEVELGKQQLAKEKLKLQSEKEDMISFKKVSSVK